MVVDALSMLRQSALLVPYCYPGKAAMPPVGELAEHPDCPTHIYKLLSVHANSNNRSVVWESIQS